MALAANLALFRLIGSAVGATVAHKAVLVDVGGVLTFGSSSHALLGQGVRVCWLSGLNRTGNCSQLVRFLMREFGTFGGVVSKTSTPPHIISYPFTH